jgi:hypothetical protein
VHGDLRFAVGEDEGQVGGLPGHAAGKDEPADPSGPALRLQRSREEGLLLLYPLDPHWAKLGQELGNTPVVGIGISFPGDRLNPSEGVEYEANLVYVGRELGDEDSD